MKKLLKYAIAAAIVAPYLFVVAFAQVSSPSFFVKNGSNVYPINPTSTTLGSSSVSAAFKNVTISGTCTGCGGSSTSTVSVPASSTQFTIPYWTSSTKQLAASSSLTFSTASSTYGYLALNTSTFAALLNLYMQTGYTSMNFGTGGVDGYIGSNDQFPGVNFGSITNYPTIFDVLNTQAAGIATSAGLPFYVGNAHKVYQNTNIFGGYEYFQADGTGDNGEDTIIVIQAPAANPQEADLALSRVDPTNGANADGVDWDDECYSASSTFINGTSSAPCLDFYASIDVLKKGTGQIRPFAIRGWNQDLGPIAPNGVFWEQLATSSAAAFGKYGSLSSSTTAWNTNNQFNILTPNTANKAFELDENTQGSSTFTVNPNGATSIQNQLSVYTSSTPGTPVNQYFYVQNNNNGGTQIGSYNSSFAPLWVDASAIDVAYRGTTVPVNLGTATTTAPLTLFGNLTQSSGTASFASVKFTTASSTFVVASMGGGSLTAGTCASTTTVLPSGVVTTTAAYITTPTVDPGPDFYWETVLIATSSVSTRVCAAGITATPTASTYNVKIIQ